MKFAKNRMYVESYVKCRNCGILIFTDSAAGAAPVITGTGGRYCSTWCVDWEKARSERLRAGGSAP